MKQYLIVYILVFICMKGVLLQSDDTTPGSNSTSEHDETASNVTANASTLVTNASLVPSPTPTPTSPETPPLTSSSPAPVPVSSTTLPSTESSPPPPPPSPEETPSTPVKISSHQFHAPSFIGGIVLALGLMAISYVGFKYYKSRTGRNYHTLQENLHM